MTHSHRHPSAPQATAGQRWGPSAASGINLFRAKTRRREEAALRLCGSLRSLRETKKSVSRHKRRLIFGALYISGNNKVRDSGLLFFAASRLRMKTS